MQQQKRIPYKILERSERRHIAIHFSKKYKGEINPRWIRDKNPKIVKNHLEKVIKPDIFA